MILIFILIQNNLENISWLLFIRLVCERGNFSRFLFIYCFKNFRVINNNSHINKFFQTLNIYNKTFSKVKISMRKCSNKIFHENSDIDLRSDHGGIVYLIQVLYRIQQMHEKSYKILKLK